MLGEVRRHPLPHSPVEAIRRKSSTLSEGSGGSGGITSEGGKRQARRSKSFGGESPRPSTPTVPGGSGSSGMSHNGNNNDRLRTPRSASPVVNKNEQINMSANRNSVRRRSSRGSKIGIPTPPHREKKVYDDNNENEEEEGVTLLRQIFPDLPTEELSAMHQNRVDSPRVEGNDLNNSSTFPLENYNDRRVSASSVTAASTADLTESTTGSSIRHHRGGHSENYARKPRPEPVDGAYQIFSIDNAVTLNTTTEGRADDEKRTFSATPIPTNHTNEITHYHSNRHGRLKVDLPDDFLRIPRDQVLKVFDSSINEFKWKKVDEMQQKVLHEHKDRDAWLETHKLGGAGGETSSSQIGGGDSSSDTRNNRETLNQYKATNDDETNETFVKILDRHPNVGLGMTIRVWNGCVYVHSLVGSDGVRLFGEVNDDGCNNDGSGRDMGPAYRAGIRTGDRILGLNGVPFLQWRLINETNDDHDGGIGLNSFDAIDIGDGFNDTNKNEWSSSNILRSAAKMIMNTPDPVVVHARRNDPAVMAVLNEQRAVRNALVEHGGEGIGGSSSLAIHRSISAEWGEHDSHAVIGDMIGGGTDVKKITSDENQDAFSGRGGFSVHPIVRALAEKGLIQTQEEQSILSRIMDQYTERTRQWESTASFRIDSKNFDLRPHFDPSDLPPSNSTRNIHFEGHQSNSAISAPSTPTLKQSGPPENCNDEGYYISSSEHSSIGGKGEESASYKSRRRRKKAAYPASTPRRTFSTLMELEKDIFIPLMGVRKALCVRIVNTFIDNDRTAYTIWVYDIESGKEWYAPVRYYRDFKDLRTAVSRLSQAIAQVPFPNVGWGVFGKSKEASESESAKESRCKQLEVFIRTLCAMVYRGALHPNVAEVAVHLQSFLGCDTCINGNNNVSLQLHMQVAVNETSYNRRSYDEDNEVRINTRLQLKRSIQRYAYRLFLLPTLDDLVSQFVDAAKARHEEEMRTLDLKSRMSLKETAMGDLRIIQDFLDQVQELIVEGSTDDLISMSKRRDFSALRPAMDGDNGSTYREQLFRDAIREQVELEVYVPLRSVISRQLVHGWRSDDREMQFKMEVLRHRPQSYFKIQPNHQSPSEWRSVSTILHEGVGRSTLPCAKLRAIVDAAKEIARLYTEEHNRSISYKDFAGVSIPNPGANIDAQSDTLSADDFLPIFIFCVVKSQIERPCALCVLLRTMCDPSKRIGETGYYLASFEAAIAHIRELDLADAETNNPTLI